MLCIYIMGHWLFYANLILYCIYNITVILIHYKCAYMDLCYQNSISIRIGTVLPVHIIKSNSDYFLTESRLPL